MVKFIERVNEFIEKVGKRNFILLTFIIIVLVISSLYGTFSLFTTSDVSYSDNIKIYKFIIGENTTNKITLGPKDSKYVDITISNQEATKLKYSIYYKSISTNIIVGTMKESEYPASGEIEANQDYTVSLKIFNNSSSDATITLGINYGTLSGGSLAQDGNQITKTIENLDKSGANEPNLPTSMIPVYYDTNSDAWKKADEDNLNPDYKWYDYSTDTKMWANAVMVSSDSRESYLNASVGTTIKSKDIIAFYVWIPRYKYRLWNANRDQVAENYSYDASNNGIEIKFENATDTTGNLVCTYNYNNKASNDSLSDNCSYNKAQITITTNNLELSDVWYTHPAFNYNRKKLTGFWVGKFETTGTEQTPTILPDTKALTNQNISEQVTTNKLFKDYGLSSDNDTHIIKNTEWGALAYFTHSNYGICSDNLCREVYINNSSSLYTGRSGGAIAGSDLLNRNNSNYNKDGYYNYQGFTIEADGMISQEKDTTKLSSTTANIYGVYDLSGGSNETVMANTYNNSNNFNPSSSSLPISFSQKYYNIYANTSDTNTKTSLNRSIMGDAIAEVSYLNDNKLTSWSSVFIRPSDTLNLFNEQKPWLVRGGDYSHNDSGLFYYNISSGDKQAATSFRSILS